MQLRTRHPLHEMILDKELLLGRIDLILEEHSDEHHRLMNRRIGKHNQLAIRQETKNHAARQIFDRFATPRGPELPSSTLSLPGRGTMCMTIHVRDLRHEAFEILGEEQNENGHYDSIADAELC